MRQPLSTDTLDQEIGRCRNPAVHSLRFSAQLEEEFEDDTARERSRRLWREGLIAILALNGCLLLDLVLVHDTGWRSILLHTALATPVALAVNLLVRRNPRRWLREGSVAAGTTLICFISLHAQGHATAATSTFDLICVLITILFVDVVMRLRLAFAASATAVMFLGGLCYLAFASGLQPSEKTVGGSLLAIGVAITMTASYSLERQERLSYLLSRRSTLQTEQLATLNRTLLDLSHIDKLTNLPNRRAFDERFDRLWTEHQRTGTELSAVVIDVDHFKLINDVFGHLYGDQVLQRLAALLPQALRGHGDLAARFGGEEFVVLLPHTPLETAILVAERLRQLVEAAGTPISGKAHDEHTMWITVSCGVATCAPVAHPGATSREHLLGAADQALYAAKTGGRNQVCHAVVPLPIAAGGEA